MSGNDLKDRLILAGKILVAEGQDDFTRGHISVRLPDDPTLFYMKPHSIGFDEITRDNILTIDLDGKVVAGNGRRHSEVFIHSEIYRARPDVLSVIHSHPPYATALSVTGRPVRAFSQPSVLFHGALDTYDASMRLIRTPEMGAAVARALGQNRAVLLRSHGVATVGRSIEEATIVTLMLENAAMIQLVAEAAGETLPDLPQADIAALREELSPHEQFVINFDYLARRVMRRN
ncbi:MAG: class II aldolase/adducin family protein [Pseudomonadota bacterium]